MEYIVISSKDKNETNFFINLFKKMNKKAACLTSKEIEEMGSLGVNAVHDKIVENLRQGLNELKSIDEGKLKSRSAKKFLSLSQTPPSAIQ